MRSSTDSKLAADESRRAVQHESVKSQVEGDVNAEIAQQAPTGSDAWRIEKVAGSFREHAVDEVASSEREVVRSRGIARVSQFIDYAFFLIYALLTIRFVLSLIAAKSSAGFSRFIVSVSEPFYAPFKGIVDSPKSAGHTVVLSMLVALAAYAVLHLVINRLLRVIAVRKTAI